MNRRAFVLRGSQVSAWMALAPAAASAAEFAAPQPAEEEAIRAAAEGFLREHGIAGMSIAYGRDGRIGLARGYGFADAEGKEAVRPEHRFRIASIAKPITATAVMLSIEKGLVTLDSPVFGAGGVLGEKYGSDLPDSVRRITVDHLLTHTCGGWANDKQDPMFRHPTMTHDELIAWTLENQRLTHSPGERYAYSNFGYSVLGRVLEKVTQQPYEALVTQQVLAKCGSKGMRIAGNTLAERQPDEVMYHTQQPGAAYGMNVARMDSHGGWIATARDLVLIASQLPRVLSESSIRTMTTCAVAPSYARGWSVNKVPNWWHAGSLPGTSTMLVHTAKGICWAGLLNGRKEGISLALDQVLWKMGRMVKAWGL